MPKQTSYYLFVLLPNNTNPFQILPAPPIKISAPKMQILARSPPLFSKLSTLLLPSATITTAAVEITTVAVKTTTAAVETAASAVETPITSASAVETTSAAAAVETTSTSASAVDLPAPLSNYDLADLRRLLPSLCDAGRPLDAVRLLDTALLTSPPLSSLPLPDLTDRLCALPDMTASMALLTALRFNPRRPSPLPFCAMMLSSYFRRRRLREAAKVFAWLCRADSPCRPDVGIYGAAVRGFCERGRAFEAVRVAREMVRDGVAVTVDLRVLLGLVLLREARVQEALDLDSALKKVGEGGDGCGDGVAELLDRMIKDWED